MQSEFDRESESLLEPDEPGRPAGDERLSPVHGYFLREQAWRRQVKDRYNAGDGPWNWD
ncbi:MAG: hypothetical protein ACRDFS_08955 [Chloroflexota bacterium]